MLLAALLSALVVPAVQDNTPPAATQDEATVASGTLSQFTFDGWNGPTIRVFTYIPAGIDRREAPILFVMHGAGRDADRYIAEWTGIADARGIILVAPEYARTQFPGGRHYNQGDLFEPDGRHLKPANEWAFAAIEPLFDTVVAQLGGAQTHYDLYGHSAGSQFVHRYLFLVPDARVRRYMAANAGWYSFPDLGTDYPYGLGSLDLAEEDLRRALAKDVVILLGDADIDTTEDNLRRTREAMRQGPHRFARGKAFFAAARDRAEREGWAFGWSLRIVPGVAHSNAGIATNAGDLVEE